MGDQDFTKKGRGRGGRGGKAQAIKNLERAAADIQNMLQQMAVSSDRDPGGTTTANRRPSSRGSKSMMDLSAGGNSQWKGPPNQGPHYPRPASQGPHYPGPPNQGPHYPGPPNQGPHYPGPPNQGPHYPGPPNQGPRYPGPPSQGYYNQGPPHQDHYYTGTAMQEQNYDPYQYPPAPPSYEESVQQPQPAPMGGDTFAGDRKVPKHSASKSVSAQQLVKALALFDGQVADTETLSKQVESPVEEIEKVVKKRKDIFAHMKDGTKVVVELAPNIKLCSRYLSVSGCMSKDSCQALHLCKNYILARCDKGPSCSYGHKFDTNHNVSILSKLYLDLIKTQQLVSVIRKICRGNAPPRICTYYNTQNGCNRMDGCGYLHICKDYVMNSGKCSISGCSFNHQLTMTQCKNILTRHGMSTNESIRDILLTLKSSLERAPPGKQSSASSGREGRNQGTGKDQGDGESSDSDTSMDHSEKSVKKKAKQKSHEMAKDRSLKPNEDTKGKSYTIKSTDFFGDVEIPEICIYAVNNKCTNEKKGCKYLHAKSLFHWQVEKEKKWYNFRIFQSKTLESAYRDVSKGGVRLPPIDVEKLNPQDQQILELFGTHNWTADFKGMCITSPANKKLKIRRVATPSSAISSMPQATVYQWHFADEQGKWIHYGHVDSLGKQDHVCNITSEDIEKQYMSDSSSVVITSNAHYKYKIDLKNMTQTNQTTMKVREIRRRPAHLSYQMGGSVSSTGDASLPAHWQPMSPQQTHILVTLDLSHAEHLDVSKMIKLTLPTARIHEIRRLQNEYLWRFLQYKKADLSRRYDDFTMNVQKLFHGTNPDSIDSICKENIEGRLYAGAKEKYGKGTYFSNSCAIARTYCTPNTHGHFFLVLAEVIIGYVTQGTKGLARPPQNASTGCPYDTTVDSLTTPTLFVKYDKEEYYPEYIIEISV